MMENSGLRVLLPICEEKVQVNVKMIDRELWLVTDYCVSQALIQKVMIRKYLPARFYFGP